MPISGSQVVMIVVTSQQVAGEFTKAVMIVVTSQQVAGELSSES
jgi:hypothetical protein